MDKHAWESNSGLACGPLRGGGHNPPVEKCCYIGYHVYFVGLPDKYRDVLRSVGSQLMGIHVGEQLLTELVSSFAITRPMKEEIDVSNTIN